MANIRRILFGIPSIFTVAITILITYQYQAKFVSAFYEDHVSRLTLGFVLGGCALNFEFILVRHGDVGFAHDFIHQPGVHSRVFLRNSFNLKGNTDNDYEKTVRVLNEQLYRQNNFIPAQKLEEIEKKALANEDEEGNRTDPVGIQTHEAVPQDEEAGLSFEERRWKLIEGYVNENFSSLVRSSCKFRYCKKCSMVKPPRSHHCSVCKKCVLRMDHHCPWVGNCVGFGNHKFFWNFLLFAFLGSGQAGGCMFTMLYQPQRQGSVDQDIVFLFSSILAVSFSLAISILFCTHTFMLSKNLSTIEMDLFRRNPFDRRSTKENL